MKMGYIIRFILLKGRVFLAVLALSVLFTGCMGPYNVILNPIKHLPGTDTAMRDATVFIETDNLGVTERTSAPDSWMGGAVKHHIDLENALKNSTITFAEDYFHLCTTDASQKKQADYILHVTCENIRWWFQNIGFAASHRKAELVSEITLRFILTDSAGSPLENFLQKEKYWVYSGNANDVSYHRNAAENALYLALRSGFEHIALSSHIKDNEIDRQIVHEERQQMMKEEQERRHKEQMSRLTVPSKNWKDTKTGMTALSLIKSIAGIHLNKTEVRDFLGEPDEIFCKGITSDQKWRTFYQTQLSGKIGMTSLENYDIWIYYFQLEKTENTEVKRNMFIRYNNEEERLLCVFLSKD
ncbi:MAG: hypothetical protein JW795_11720 [Chitinivibrionales bacterium]|nr:hypothetical protein [Chitinivibrionales bacterium]